MQYKQVYFFFVFTFFLCVVKGSAQSNSGQLLEKDTLATTTGTDSLFTIGTITVTGNKKTKESIILREIFFKSGDAYPLPEIVKKFEAARRQLMNTTLFHSVLVAAKDFDGYTVNIIVTVVERWYLFPVPYFKPVDRNLNQWIVEQKANLSRVNYGIKLLHTNATGRNDKLKLFLISGYTKQLSFFYDRLYIDKNYKWGLRVGVSSGNNREINYNTIENKQVFYRDPNRYVRKFTNSFFELTYRPATKTRHSFGVGYSAENVIDTVQNLNPQFYKGGYKSIRFPEVYYSMLYFNLDYIPYPTTGYAAEINISKRGFNNKMNMSELRVKGLGAWPILPKTFISLSVFGDLKLPFRQPYSNLRLLGYGDNFLQGFEYYVIDGVAASYIKTTLSREIFNFKIRVPPLKRDKEAIYIPFRIFTKVYGNTGYVHNPQPGINNFLANKMLYSGGFGIDILSFYDVTFKLEWSFNQLGQNGLFLHRKSIF